LDVAVSSAEKNVLAAKLRLKENERERERKREKERVRERDIERERERERERKRDREGGRTENGKLAARQRRVDIVDMMGVMFLENKIVHDHCRKSD
jgi:Ni/Co efflux regulator RcnB